MRTGVAVGDTVLEGMAMRYPAVKRLASALAGAVVAVSASTAFGAETIPGPADVGRVQPQVTLPAPDHSQDQNVVVPGLSPTMPVPESAKNVHFVLRQVVLEGSMRAFTFAQLEDIYALYYDKDVTLDIAYAIAGAITERYSSAGYFLSLAYIPDQQIENGSLTIRVVEGYIGKVDVPGDAGNRRVVQDYIDRLTAQRPVTSAGVESFLLRLNDLPGLSFRAVLSPLEGAEEGATKLILEPAPKEGKGSITFDNFSSHYLGPDEVSVAYATSLLPLQQTAVSGLSAFPVDKMRYGTVDHSIVIAPDLTLDLSGGVTRAYPGYTLKPEDINSTATSAGMALIYQLIRQRQENLSFRLSLDGRDVTSDILDTPQTRDRIRAIRLGASYDLSDSWNGYNTATFTVSQGLPWLGASAQDSSYLSRTNAAPDFQKEEFSLARLQGITSDWSVYASAAGQHASGPLYSSEEFGYGGTAFGRAYDTSEITGDHGIAGSLELRYAGWNAWEKATFQPYTFYDIGEVWNEAAGQPKRESGASAGFGVRFTTFWGENGNLGLAWPLTRDISAPIYGESRQGPRFLLQIGQAF